MTGRAALSHAMTRFALPLRVGLCLLAFAGLAAIVPPRTLSAPAGPVPGVARPAGSVQSLLAITEGGNQILAEAEQAQSANAAIPLVANGLQAAKPFGLPAGLGAPVANRAEECLALAMYYEAAFEGSDGRRAVAQVVLNRVRHPAYPHSVCGVVFQQASNVCQFTFACDGAMARPRNPALWRQTMAEARAALGGSVYAPVGMATHYHADYVLPAWAYKLDKVAVIGRHLFYRWPNGWGLRGAFTAAYRGEEAEVPLPVLEPALDATILPPDLAPVALEPAPVRSQNEGGFIDPSKGWVPRVSRSSVTAEPVPQAGPSTALD